MNENVTISQKVAILIDGNNIERGLHEVTNKYNTMLDFDRVVPRLLESRTLNRLIYFREGENISEKLAERLQDRFHGSVHPCGKGADIPLTIRATQLASKVDTIIIMSGDADYIELVKHLKHEGVRVEIAAVERCTSAALIKESDRYFPMIKEDCFIYDGRKK